MVLISRCICMDRRVNATTDRRRTRRTSLIMMTGQCLTLLVKISIFVGQNVGEMGGYGIGIAAGFVRQLIKTKFKIMP
jgi:hypothetical protein